tara:strand:+ start:9 stop:1898 length:1890 start_codon:yes stop_codon:yes gene_type:complete
MTLEEMLRGSPLTQQRMADDNAMNLAGMLARGRAGTVQQEPNMVERGLSNVKRSFYGDKNLYGNDPINPSVLDSQYVSPEMAEGAVLDFVGGPMTFAGIGSRTANKLALQKAQDLAGQGVNRKQIWDETGWFNDVDNKWKYEIDDSGLQAKHGVDMGIMNDTARHEKLNNAYPEMGNVMISNKHDLRERGSYAPGESREHMGLFDLTPEITTFGETQGRNRSVLGHELQHGVQELEGFAKGGSPDDFESLDLVKHWKDNNLEGRLSDLSAMSERMGKDMPYKEKHELVNLMRRNEEIMRGFDEGTYLEPYDQYKRLAGEAEARNVQTRMDFTPEQRQAQPPWKTLDVPEEELLVRMLQDGPSLATAYHGSPHKFSKFDMSKIGTGEGAQAYGHGIYAAENPNVAKNYAPRDFDYEESLMDAYKRYEQQGDYEAMEIYERAMMHETPAEIRASALDPESVLYEMQDTALRVADEIAEIPINSSLYKVDIPDDQIAKMLDWDKPLSEQGEKMHKVWEKFLGSGVGKRARKSLGPGGNFNQPTGEDFHSLIYEGMPRAKGQTHGGGATFQEGVMAADWLKRQGIPGIKYLDGDSRSGSQGTSNFVLFADEIAKILERNDQPIGDLAEGLQRK